MKILFVLTLLFVFVFNQKSYGGEPKYRIRITSSQSEQLKDHLIQNGYDVSPFQHPKIIEIFVSEEDLHNVKIHFLQKSEKLDIVERAG